MRGRTGRKSGGKAPNEDKAVLAEAKERKHGGKIMESVGPIKGGKPSAHAGRKPRKSGGRSGSNFNPLSSAASGSSPKGHSTPGDKN
jgi:hypothetical protein